MDSSEHDIDATERVPMWFEDEALAEGSAPVLFAHPAGALMRGTPERPTLRYMGPPPVSAAVGAERAASASDSFEIDVESPVVEPANPVVDLASPAIEPARPAPRSARGRKRPARQRPVRATPRVDVSASQAYVPPMPAFGAAMLQANKRGNKPVAPVFTPPVFVAPPLPAPAVASPAFAPTMLALPTTGTAARSASFGATMLRDFYALLVVMAGSAALFLAAYFIGGR
jgi:hypothetical protein